MFTGPTPDITPAQILGAVAAIVGQLVAWGVIDSTRSQVIISIGAYTLTGVLFLADAYLRGQRAKAMIPPARQPITTTPPPAG